MIVIDPCIYVYSFDSDEIMSRLELFGRVCYKSEDKITNDSARRFISRLVAYGHESVLEHASISVKFIVDRGVSHELVRHRVGSYSQESTRYVNYGHVGEICFIRPFFFVSHDDVYRLWEKEMCNAEATYMNLLKLGVTPQEARSVLPSSTKTEIVATYNLREWRHFFKLRAQKTAHPQMQQVAIPLLLYFQDKLPQIFGDISYNSDFESKYYAKIIEVKEGIYK